VDILARKNELVKGATDRNLEFPRYFESFTATDDIESLSKFVASRNIVTTLGNNAHEYNFPNEIYWREEAIHAFGHLQFMQTLADGDSRLRFVPAAADAVVDIERKIDAFGSKTPPALVRFETEGKIDLHASDQIVIVDGHVNIRRLMQELDKSGQCLPIVPFDDSETNYARKGTFGSLQTAISLNLPHGLEAQCGSWRDWILGMTVMLADGSIVKSGSQVVKNVAGYDAHKLFVGARGTLGIILKVILRTYPKDALPKHEVEVRRRIPVITKPENKFPIPWIQRTKPSDFSQAVFNAGEKLLEIDWATSTLWADVQREDELPRYADDWVIRRGCLEKNIQITDPVQIALLKRTKQIFDPANKFNPGAMGVV